MEFGHDVLTTRAQPQRAELTASGQTIGGETPPVDVGHQAATRFHAPRSRTSEAERPAARKRVDISR
ncbi:hypothetical protein SMICM304S_05183 [Streptomyces microflavus]